MDFPDDFLHIAFSLAYFIVGIQGIIRVTFKLCVHRPSMLLVRFPIHSRLLVVRSKVISEFSTVREGQLP